MQVRWADSAECMACGSLPHSANTLTPQEGPSLLLESLCVAGLLSLSCCSFLPGYQHDHFTGTQDSVLIRCCVP